MSIQYPEAMNTSDLQIWNNAAFDNRDSEDMVVRVSWSPVKPIFVNQSKSTDFVSSEENQSPVPVKSPVSVKTPAPVKPPHPNGVIGNSQGKPKKLLFQQVLSEKAVSRNESEEEVRDERRIDADIEKIQIEIRRLSSKLEALWLEKAEQKVKALERRGRVVPAKFMEQKQSVKNADGVKKIEESSSMSTRTKVLRRGVSLGPSEIAAGVRRGVSLGPAQIVAGAKSQQLGKQQITPVQPIQNRRKSCFWKLQDIDEEDITKERRKSLTVGPKSRKSISRSQAPRQAATTVESKKAVKKEEGVLSTIQPKKLFEDGGKSLPAKKPLKPCRVVASRYNQNTVQNNGNSAMRKRSLPENDKEDSKRCDKKRASSVGNSCGSLSEISENQCNDSLVKKRCDIPSEIVVHRNLVDDNSPQSIAKMRGILQLIRTVRCTTDSARDSGPAKRVAELIGKKSYFCNDKEAEPAICQALSFAQEFVEEK